MTGYLVVNCKRVEKNSCSLGCVDAFTSLRGDDSSAVRRNAHHNDNPGTNHCVGVRDIKNKSDSHTITDLHPNLHNCNPHNPIAYNHQHLHPPLTPANPAG